MLMITKGNTTEKWAKVLNRLVTGEIYTAKHHKDARLSQTQTSKDGSKKKMEIKMRFLSTV